MFGFFSGCNISPSSPSSGVDRVSAVAPRMGGGDDENRPRSSNHVMGRWTGYENITQSRATLGRLASMKCTAKNLEGKKMVSFKFKTK